MTTQTVPLINRTLQIPLVASVIEDSSVLVPPMYAVVIEQVNVIFPVVLLKIKTTSPVENVELGMVIEPLDPTSISSPISVVASV